MTMQSYLRKRPIDRAVRARALSRVTIALTAGLLFAVVDMSGGVRTSRLTKQICEAREEIRGLKSELACAVSWRGSHERRNVVLSLLERTEGFATPDSGHLVQLHLDDPGVPTVDGEEIQRAGIW